MKSSLLQGDLEARGGGASPGPFVILCSALRPDPLTLLPLHLSLCLDSFSPAATLSSLVSLLLLPTGHPGGRSPCLTPAFSLRVCSAATLALAWLPPPPHQENAAGETCLLHSVQPLRSLRALIPFFEFTGTSSLTIKTSFCRTSQIPA